MLIEQVSPRTGLLNVMDIDVTEEQLIDWRNGMLAQEAMPNLTADEREFIMTGLTAEDWEAICGSVEEDSTDDAYLSKQACDEVAPF
jgi:hypothetical protein